MALVSLIILNWNGLEHLHDCLESLKNQTFRDFECLIVDNGSQDGSQEYLKNSYAWVRLIELKHNSGFASGNVEGFKRCSGDFIVTLNNDTVVDQDWLYELVAVALRFPEAGMVASRICSYWDRDLIDSLGVKICLDGMSRGAFRGKRYNTLENISDLILLPSACAALYRRKMLEQIGFFDESFFAYCEDTDLGLRGRAAGWDARLAKNAIVYHKYSATAGSFSPFKLFLVERNHFWTVFKNFPLILLVLLPLTTLFRYLVQAIVVARSTGSGGSFMASSDRKACLWALIKALVEAVSCPRYLFAARMKTDAIRRVSDGKMIRLILKHRMKISQLLDSD